MKQQVLEIGENFLRKEVNLLTFLVYSKELILFKKLILESGYINEGGKSNKELNELLNEITINEQNLDASIKNVNFFQEDLIFKAKYQVFEEYLFDILAVIYSNYPKFLGALNSELDFDLIYNQNDLTKIRNTIIERRVKALIQSNNIVAVLDKFKLIFGFDLEISNENKNQLFFFSRVRNILTHNNGIVNEIFMSDLKKQKIKHRFKLGDSLYTDLRLLSGKFSTLSHEIYDSIESKIIEKIVHFEKYNPGK